MERLNLPKKISLLKHAIIKTNTAGISMCLRLFFFLVTLVITMLLGVVIVLLVTGTFTAGLYENEKLVQNELHHISQSISKQYGQFSLQAVGLSESVSQSMEKNLARYGKTPSDIKNHPHLLEDLLYSEYERIFFSLQASKTSGVFIVLDATVNPYLENAEYSRAGLYIKNMEPNIISASAPTIHILRGFPSISRKNSHELHAQWRMEFDIKDAAFFERPMETVNEQTAYLPLSRLYYWTHPFTLPGTSEEIMLCSVPLIDSDGNVFGVCGFEISAMLFKLSYMPSNNTYNRIFAMLSPLSGEIINAEHSMFAGGYSARNIFNNNGFLKITQDSKTFNTYSQNNGGSFLGFHTPVSLYPEGSAFIDEKWATAIMIPTEDIISSVTRLNLALSAWLALLVIIGILISFILSRRYIKPIIQGFDIIKSADLCTAPRTKVPEIDDLIVFLSNHNDDLHRKARENDLPIAVLDDFLENTKSLSPAERSVFNLYVKGYTAKEIAAHLCLSINTIKTHNKRIYMKLNISSRRELLLYVNMLKELGEEFK